MRTRDDAERLFIRSLFSFTPTALIHKADMVGSEGSLVPTGVLSRLYRHFHHLECLPRSVPRCNGAENTLFVS